MQLNKSIGLQNPKLSGYILSQRRYLGTYTFWRVLSVVAITPFPVITQRIVDDSIKTGNVQSVWHYTLLIFALIAVHWVSMRQGVRSLSTQSQIIFRRLRSRVFNKLNFMHFGFLDSVQTGRLLSKYAFDTSNIETTVIQIVTGVLPELLRSLLIIVALAWINLWLLLIVAVCIPVFVYVRLKYFRTIEDNNYKVRLAREKMTGQASEFISAIKLVRGYGQEGEAKRQLGTLSDAYSDSRESQMLLNQSLAYLLFVAVSILSALAVAFCAWLVIEGQLTEGALVALIGALPVCLSPVNVITQFSLQYLLGAESYRSIKELIDSGYVEDWKGDRILDPMIGRVEFDNVSFSYDPDKPPAVKDLSVEIAAGEHVAFVGPSGSGKSTLVSLMLGFYAPSGGEIRIDGVPQRDLAIRDFRQECAIVMQDNLLLSGTLLDNIRFGNPAASMEEVVEAARSANALEFINDLPEGFDTKVGERGVSLSGGQRQRIAIARALLRNPKVLILDEATSALDYESEKMVQQAIDRLAEGRTTITIAHRLSTIRNVDRIVVMKNGEKAAEGTWEDLASQEGAFKDLLSAGT